MSALDDLENEANAALGRALVRLAYQAGAREREVELVAWLRAGADRVVMHRVGYGEPTTAQCELNALAAWIESGSWRSNKQEQDHE